MRIVSGVQPTNDLHIGNYLGAINQWVSLQNDNECVFFIADLHALTSPYNPKELPEMIHRVAIAYIAAGLDPTRSIIFVQSQVKEHTELAWLLNIICPVGELQRMTQYKDKAQKFKENINAGLFNYPLLMSADVLLYKATAVPVGKDQEQHLELIRTLAKKFNQKFGQTFKEPKSLMLKEGSKIMSLQDPRKKMSKSDDPKSYISLFDSQEAIAEKIMKATTDSGKDIIYSPIKKPGISNLLIIYSLFSGKTIPNIAKEFKGKGYNNFKKSLIDLLSQSLNRFRRKYIELENQKDYVNEILRQGKERAKLIAQETMEEVRRKMGLHCL